MLEALRLAVCRAGEQPLPAVQFANQLPEWVHKIADELTCTVFKGIVNMAPRNKKYHARKAGQIIGLLIRVAIFYWKDVTAILDREGLSKLTPSQKENLEKLTGWEVGMTQASHLAGKPIITKTHLIRFLKRRVYKHAIDTIKVGWGLIIYALHQPVEDVLQFLTGLPEGFKSFLKTDGEFAKTGKRTEIFFVLLMYWPEIEEMRQANPPLGKPYVLAWLEKQEGKQLIASEHAFSELCNDITLDFGLTGHPFNRPEVQV